MNNSYRDFFFPLFAFMKFSFSQAMEACKHTLIELYYILAYSQRKIMSEIYESIEIVTVYL